MLLIKLPSPTNLFAYIFSDRYKFLQFCKCSPPISKIASEFGKILPLIIVLTSNDILLLLNFANLLGNEFPSFKPI